MPNRFSIDAFKPSLVSLVYQYEIANWMEIFHCSLVDLKVAVKAVGPGIADVRLYLKETLPNPESPFADILDRPFTPGRT